MTPAQELIYLREENAQQRSELIKLRTSDVQHRADISQLRLNQVAQDEKITFLLETIERLGVKKTSHNSSLSPGSDINRKSTSLRTKSEKKSGGQPGHEGHTLKMVSIPDETIELKSERCEKCGAELTDAEFELYSKRQVIEIPPIKPIYRQYEQYACNCGCGHLQKGAYPTGVEGPIQYGPSIITLVSYLSVFQYVPYKRMSQLLEVMLGLRISQGTIDNLLTKASERLSESYEQIHQNLSKVNVVGGDETSAKVNGKKWWMWVWQDVLNTFIVAAATRGFCEVEAQFKEGFPQAVLVSDRLAAQLKTVAAGHQVCIAHLLRDVKYLIEAEKLDFSKGFKTLLKKALDFRAELETQKLPAASDHPMAREIEKELNRLLALPINKNKSPESATFQNQLILKRNFLLPFLYNLEIPPDNNASERAIRNIKVKQKVSGQFKSGQHAFAVIRSVIDTLIKRKMDVFSSLRTIIDGTNPLPLGS